MVLEGIAQRTIREMTEQGNVFITSKETTYHIDHDSDMKFRKVQIEFQRKRKCSEAYINELQSKTTHNYIN